MFLGGRFLEKISQQIQEVDLQTKCWSHGQRHHPGSLAQTWMLFPTGRLESHLFWFFIFGWEKRGGNIINYKGLGCFFVCVSIFFCLEDISTIPKSAQALPPFRKLPILWGVQNFGRGLAGTSLPHQAFFLVPGNGWGTRPGGECWEALGCGQGTKCPDIFAMLACFNDLCWSTGAAQTLAIFFRSWAWLPRMPLYKHISGYFIILKP